MKRILFTLIIAACFAVPVLCQGPDRHTISGYIREAGTDESLIGVNVFLSDRRTGTVTNTYGFYSLTLPHRDSITLVVSYIGYTTKTFTLDFSRDIELNIELSPNIVLDEVIITGRKEELESRSVKMSTISVPVSQIRNVPSLLGEKDVLKVLQLMPGVQKGSEGSSGLYVRGGGPDQNLIILDDAIVYNASHLFGFFSLFNGDALKSVELTKGGFPARYGGRLSSVLDMNMKEGNKEEWHGEGGIGLISSRMTVEGPLKKGKSSILISGRRTYADIIVKPLLAEGENTGYYFYDLNAKINYDFGRKNKLYLSGYFGNDKFYNKFKSEQTNENVGLKWGNITGTIRWNHLFNAKLFSNMSAIVSSYTFGIYDKYRVLQENKNYYAEYYSGIKDYSFKYDIDYIPAPNHWIKAGVTSIYHVFNPHAFVEVDIPANINIRQSSTTDGIESGIYLEDTWQPFEALKINGGVRFTHFLAQKNNYHFFEPRFSAAWRLKNDLAFKASYAMMNQYIHLISNTGINLPTDLWVPTTDKVKPQQSHQVAGGFVKDFTKHDIALTIEGYYKTMANTITYKEGATFITFDDPEEASGISWEDNITAGHSWSYGFEFLLQKKVGKLNGWIGYTLSWTRMQFDSVNFGRKFYARYDRRHDFSIVAMYKLNNRITLSGTWVYGTGNAVTLPSSEYYLFEHFPENYKPVEWQYNTMWPHYLLHETFNDLTEKNNFRMAAYHRLDVGVQFHKEKRWGERTWEISVYNAYNRKNPFFYYNDTKIVNNQSIGILKQVSLFPIIPSVTYSFRF